ncbi:alkaline phosphatase D family protein, partial [Streptomyces sp. NPDC049910]|uniref:alkaline phosphatase D family protein n=1 Tax=Streptomyces sp. NPDC049910 TaxID=3155278 RepID=UPI00343E9C82
MKDRVRTTTSRRTVVKAAAATAVAGSVMTGTHAASPASAREQAPAFVHGVASGDPLPDGVLLWTRVTPSPDALPGSGKGPATEVGWEIAEDREFTRVVAGGLTTTTAVTDHTVKVDVRGLRPAATYYFRFLTGTAVSPVGRTRTAPAADAAAPGLRFGVVSCSNWESGYFAAYRHLAARADLDAVLHLGDYIYEYGTGHLPDDEYVVRRHEPAHEITTLSDYRTRHGMYKTDTDLQAMHAAHPLIAIWDDHEIANNSWSGGAQNHTPGTEGDYAARAAAAKQAYFEWMPVRTST